MGSSERLTISFNKTDWEERNYSTMGVSWTFNMKERGVWVKYNRSTSHRDAFSVLMQGMWEAMMNPDDYVVEQDHRGETEPEPYWSNIG